MKFFSPLLLSMFLLCSCATITRGVHEKLKVESDPSGAEVILSTGEKGFTPVTFVEKRRREAFTVTVSKPGYVSQTVTVQSKAGGTGGTAMAGNLLIGGAIGMGIDAGTGAYDSLYPNPVSVQLKPIGGKSSSKMTKTTKPENHVVYKFQRGLSVAQAKAVSVTTPVDRNPPVTLLALSANNWLAPDQPIGSVIHLSSYGFYRARN